MNWKAVGDRVPDLEEMGMEGEHEEVMAWDYIHMVCAFSFYPLFLSFVCALEIRECKDHLNPLAYLTWLPVVLNHPINNNMKLACQPHTSAGHSPGVSSQGLFIAPLPCASAMNLKYIYRCSLRPYTQQQGVLTMGLAPQRFDQSHSRNFNVFAVEPFMARADIHCLCLSAHLSKIIP